MPKKYNPFAQSCALSGATLGKRDTCIWTAWNYPNQNQTRLKRPFAWQRGIWLKYMYVPVINFAGRFSLRHDYDKHKIIKGLKTIITRHNTFGLTSTKCRLNYPSCNNTRMEVTFADEFKGSDVSYSRSWYTWVLGTSKGHFKNENYDKISIDFLWFSISFLAVSLIFLLVSFLWVVFVAKKKRCTKITLIPQSMCRAVRS